RRHTILVSDWSSDVCSSDLQLLGAGFGEVAPAHRHAEAGAEQLRDLGRRPQLEHALALPALQQALGLLELVQRQPADARVVALRSEERRVGKEGRSRWSADE